MHWKKLKSNLRLQRPDVRIHLRFITTVYQILIYMDKRWAINICKIVDKNSVNWNWIDRIKWNLFILLSSLGGKRCTHKNEIWIFLKYSIFCLFNFYRSSIIHVINIHRYIVLLPKKIVWFSTCTNSFCRIFFNKQ